jgi:hypothetical protein
MVGAAFGFRVKDVPKAELLITLEAFLISQTSQGKRCLLIVDEAQNLTPRAVEELRMLSNFQLGTQSLLQSFLVGQPEFREILQRPEMEQFRQRVAATCHLGPLDLEDTGRYIEHRLKCAGSSGKPSFEAAAIDAIYKTSHGVPRRINAVCDRLLLLGFMAGKTHIEVGDVDEVAEEFARESEVPDSAKVAAKLAVNGASHDSLPLDLDLTHVNIDPTAVEGLAQQLAGLGASREGDRMARLEHSLMRLEQVNVKTLSLLQALVDALKRPQGGGPT